MNVSKPLYVVCATILAETSPQALPLGIACVAAAVKESGVASGVSLIDISYDEATDRKEDVASLLTEQILNAYRSQSEEAYLVVLYSAYVWNIKDLIRSIQLLKEKYTGTLVTVCGGPEVTARCGRTGQPPIDADFSVFDYLITGEGETATVELLKSLNGGTPHSSSLIHGNTEDCSKLVSPWLSGIIDPVTYNGVLWELSRGCPFSCSYCYESKGEKTVRKLPELRLEQELDVFALKKVPQIFVLDPTFNADRDRSLRLLMLMEKKLPDAHYQFEIRAEFMDKQLAQSFSRLACSLQIGLQSANPEVLKNIHRSFDRKNFSRKIALLNEYGLVFGFDLIYGLPGDTLPSFRESIDYAVSLYPNHLELFRLSILPGTALYEQAESFGLKFDSKPPYHIQYTPKFSQSDLLKAEHLAFACNVFYSAGRAVPWFLSLIHPLKIRPSQFFMDFAEWQRCNNCARNTGFDPCVQKHIDIERMQLSFLKFKYEEKQLAYAFPAVRDVITLNGAMARAAGEGETCIIDVSYNPDDIFSGEAMDILLFVEETCMEKCRVRIFPGEEGPDYQILS